MKIRSFILFILFFSIIFAQGQINIKDSLTKNLDEVIVSATRTEQKLSNATVPVSIISQKQITAIGSLRLNDILQEQTGLAIVNNFGVGVQMQGLSPEYTLILIDGEPLIGRNGGVFDLSRLTVSNIKKIEIVKGPSSSLYGSEALAGVVNIITTNFEKSQISSSLRIGSFKTIDANIYANKIYKKIAFNFSANRYSSDGFDFNKNTVGKTQEPFQNYTYQFKLKWNIDANNNITYSNRLFDENQSGKSIVNQKLVSLSGNLNEINHTVTFLSIINEKIKNQFRFYSSQYRAIQSEIFDDTKIVNYYDYFKQNYYKLENQLDIKWLKNNSLTFGGGLLTERLNTNRYNSIKKNNQLYSFLQNDWKLKDHSNFIVGIRIDKNSSYKTQVSPKVSLQHKLNAKLNINASYGYGFKAPDYRQQYLNFTNNTAGGYTVYGANEISYNDLFLQKQQGILSELTNDASALGLLKPESSRGLNVGILFTPNSKVKIKVNIFDNEIKNQIINKVVAFKAVNSAPIFSYFNVNQSFSRGLETDLNLFISKKINLSMGYQYLLTGDKEITTLLKDGKIFGKTLGTLNTVQLTMKDYGGLYNTSKHNANIKLFYENGSKYFANLRAIFKSKFGVTDIDGNGIANRDDEFVKGYLMLNISAGKTLYQKLKIQAGLDNIFNYTNPRWLTNLPGRTFYTTLLYNLK